MLEPAVLTDLPAPSDGGLETGVSLRRQPATLGGPLDAFLPWRGLPYRALHEVSGLAGTNAVAAMARRCLRRGGSLVWCRDRRLAGELGKLDGGTLDRFGLTPERVTVTEATGETETAAAFAEALRCRSVACAIVEVGRLELATSRRLQHAAESGGGGVGLLLRPDLEWEPSAALTRWHATPFPSGGSFQWKLVLWHARGGAPGVGRVRWDDRVLAFAPADGDPVPSTPAAAPARPTVPAG